MGDLGEPIGGVRRKPEGPHRSATGQLQVAHTGRPHRLHTGKLQAKTNMPNLTGPN